MDENETSIEEIVERVEDIVTNLAQFTAQFTLDLPDATVSLDAANRIVKFNTCVYVVIDAQVR
jgi:phosphoglycerate-specific signal transduction histidine kinase